MSNDTIKLSYQPLILVGSGVTPTVPENPSSLPGDAGWVDSSDLLIGQLAFNVTDSMYYTRTKDGIEPLKSTMYYIHDQGVPSDEWTINHRLGPHPSVTITDTGGEVYLGEVTYTSSTQLKIKFNGGFSGKAYLV